MSPGERRVQVAPIEVERSPRRAVVRVPARFSGSPSWQETLTYRLRGKEVEAIDPTGDVALATYLIPAMRSQVPLDIQTPCSPELLDALPDIQKLYSSFSTEFTPIAVVAERATAPPCRANGTGLFFSGGVDAFHTLLTTQEPLTHLVLIAGFDFHEHLARRKEDAISSAQAVADARGLELIVVETNYRTSPVTNRQWKFGHGATLFAVAHSLRGVLGSCVVSASDTAETVAPWGTRPDLDPLWSSESIRLLHVGHDVSRWDKVRLVGADPLARKHLRVCSDETVDAVNCGHCRKCVMTRLALYATGDLDAVETLPSGIERREIMPIALTTRFNQILIRRVLVELEAKGDERVATMIRQKLTPSPARRTAQRARKVARRAVRRMRRRTSRSAENAE